MIVGFTGTRKGMSEAQQQQLAYILALFRHADLVVSRITEFHHGGARGADSEAADIARASGMRVFCHPCPGVTRDVGDPHVADIWLEVFPPLVRDRHIVQEAHVLVAAPETDKEVLRSGTWATVRYARDACKPVVMLSRGEERT